MAAFVYKPQTALDVCLHLLDYAVKADIYESVLDTLGAGIRKIVARIDTVGSEEAVEYEIEIIEGMLGAAYVVCQTQINAVVQAALRVPGKAATFPKGAADVRVLGPELKEKIGA